MFECKDKGKKDEEGKREQAFVVHMTDSSESESSKQVFHNQQNSEIGGSEVLKYEDKKDFVHHLKLSSESESKQGSHNKSKKRKATDDGEELDDDILICGLKVKNLSLEDISKIFKENFNAFKKLKIGDTKNINLLKSVKKTNSPHILTQINNCSMLTIWLITNS